MFVFSPLMGHLNVDNFDSSDFTDISISGQYHQILGDFNDIRKDYRAKRTNPENTDNALRMLVMRMKVLKESPVYREHLYKWIMDEVWISPLDKEMQDYRLEVLRHDMPAWTGSDGILTEDMRRDDLPYSTAQIDSGLRDFMVDESNALDEERYDLEDLRAESESSKSDALTARLYQRALKSRNRAA